MVHYTFTEHPFHLCVAILDTHLLSFINMKNSLIEIGHVAAPIPLGPYTYTVMGSHS